LSTLSVFVNREESIRSPRCTPFVAVAKTAVSLPDFPVPDLWRAKAHKLQPILRAALLADQAKHAIGSNLELHTKAA
jgi:hypothetical protein